MVDALSEAPTFGIAKILQEGRFVVPSHQRDYSWTVDEVQQLFDDVEDAIKKKSESYFLGLLVFFDQRGEIYSPRWPATPCYYSNYIRGYTRLAASISKSPGERS